MLSTKETAAPGAIRSPFFGSTLVINARLEVCNCDPYAHAALVGGDNINLCSKGVAGRMMEDYLRLRLRVFLADFVKEAPFSNDFYEDCDYTDVMTTTKADEWLEMYDSSRSRTS